MAGTGNGVLSMYLEMEERDSEKRNCVAMVLDRYGLPPYISRSHAVADPAVCRQQESHP
jgi:hypothetical protein